MSVMRQILQLMPQQQASDAFFSAGAPVQLKINGQLHPVNSQPLAKDTPLALLGEVVSGDRLAELQATGELNTSYTVDGVGQFRISAMRQRGTYAVVVRYISSTIPPIDTLGLPAVLKDLVTLPRGLILLLGATGSGKSTTIASMLDHRNSQMPGHILTVEQPIEYWFQNKRSIVNQREVGDDTESLEVALRNALRQAPDVIMIGEIRDRETMSAALAYAQSGHLCISTLHANNSYHALNRILSFFPLEVRPSLLQDLGASLKALVGQRLVRTTDKRRMPAVEVMINSAHIADLIVAGDFHAIRDVIERSLSEGSQSFEQDLARLVFDGHLEREEAMKHADSPTNLSWRLQQGRDTDVYAVSDSVLRTNDDHEPSFEEFSFNVRPQS